METPEKKNVDILAGNRERKSFTHVLFLRTLSLMYLHAVQLRNYLYETNRLKIKKLPCKVISIGNLCAGGTGKTPMTMYVSELIRKHGYRVCVVTRGYKGKAEKRGGIVSDGKEIFMSPEFAGDEPFMMAGILKQIPIIVGRDRFKSGMTAIKQFGAEVIVLDDAYQHRKLFRDLDLVLLDDKTPFGNGKLLPFGRLREPITALSRSHAVIFTRSNMNSLRECGERSYEAINILKTHPIFHSKHLPNVCAMIPSGKTKKASSLAKYSAPVKSLEGKRAVAFSGLADNSHFKNTLLESRIEIAGFYGFPDHHAYSEKDLRTLIEAGTQATVDCLVTTEKDFVKLPDDLSWPVALAVVGVKLSMGTEEEAFEHFLINHISH
jgi:tetraacyldisaccharide 4'-kinase